MRVNLFTLCLGVYSIVVSVRLGRKYQARLSQGVREMRSTSSAAAAGGGRRRVTQRRGMHRAGRAKLSAVSRNTRQHPEASPAATWRRRSSIPPFALTLFFDFLFLASRTTDLY